ncbi:MAG: C45 family autoproteolytic acyltransferase/hydrolase [Planctomycetaceae bacterium]|nr:C45 family autoproteolytic acyltransferase/hydrolase [Planctomycetaceae bacterium]
MSTSATPWTESPVLTVALDEPATTRYEHVPESIRELGRNLLDGLATQLPQTPDPFLRHVIATTDGRFDAETRALADILTVPWQELTVANLAYDIAVSLFGCSTIALPTPSGPVVARNMDWPQQDILARSSCLIRYTEKGRLKFANAGWPGAVGAVTGLSGNGFCVTLNAVLSSEPPSTDGYPVLLQIRRVLEDADNFDAALKALSEQPLTTSALLTLVGTDNDQRVVIERSANRCALRWPEGDAPLITTNDYRELARPQTSDEVEIYETTCSRFDYLTSFFESHSPDTSPTNDHLLYALTEPSVIQSITAQHIIMHPASSRVQLFVPTRYLT